MFRGLVQPTDSERLLNGDTYRLRHAKRIDTEELNTAPGRSSVITQTPPIIFKECL